MYVLTFSISLLKLNEWNALGLHLQRQVQILSSQPSGFQNTPLSPSFKHSFLTSSCLNHGAPCTPPHTQVTLAGCPSTPFCLFWQCFQKPIQLCLGEPDAFSIPRDPGKGVIKVPHRTLEACTLEISCDSTVLHSEMLGYVNMSYSVRVCCGVWGRTGVGASGGREETGLFRGIFWFCRTHNEC